MRAFDRDLIRGGHYGQRPCVPHLKAEHMAAPTKTANVKKALANSGPSTHGNFASDDFRSDTGFFFSRGNWDVQTGNTPRRGDYRRVYDNRRAQPNPFFLFGR
jgi:hypothetical protein